MAELGTPPLVVGAIFKILNNPSLIDLDILKLLYNFNLKPSLDNTQSYPLEIVNTCHFISFYFCVPSHLITYNCILLQILFCTVLLIMDNNKCSKC